MFDELKEGFSFPKIEAEVLEFWRKNKIFEKTLDLGTGRPDFVFYEGPPTANGKPGIHHVIARTIKDLICRYKTMQGYRVERKAGWDTHGLPVELEVEKELGLNSKARIEEYGIEKFNAKCRESVFRYKIPLQNPKTPENHQKPDLPTGDRGHKYGCGITTVCGAISHRKVP